MANAIMQIRLPTELKKQIKLKSALLDEDMTFFAVRSMIERLERLENNQK